MTQRSNLKHGLKNGQHQSKNFCKLHSESYHLGESTRNGSKDGQECCPANRATSKRVDVEFCFDKRSSFLGIIRHFRSTIQSSVQLHLIGFEL